MIGNSLSNLRQEMIMQKTLSIHLEEQRKEIIKEIQRHIPHGSMCDITMIYEQVISIIKGSYK